MTSSRPPGTRSTGAPFSKVGTAAATWNPLVTDHLGTPIYALTTAGAQHWLGGFEPFGRDYQQGTGQDSLTKGIFLRLPGQWDDTLLGGATLGADVYYNVHRWYEPGSGRYASSDPVAWYTKDPMVYSYAKSLPLRSTDAFGLLPVDCEDCLPLLRAKRNAQRRVFLLQTTGSEADTSPGASNQEVGRTWCGFGLPGEGGNAFTEWGPGRGAFPDSPCLFLCSGVHERTHRQMCRRMGFEYGLLDRQGQEIPAYEEEIRCLSSALRDGRLELSPRGVGY